MDIAEKTLRLKTDFDDVYEAGKKAEYDEFWDNALNGDGWVGRFCGNCWTDKTFKPNKDLLPYGNSNNLFNAVLITNLTKILNDNEVKLDVSQVTGFNSSFSWTTITHIPYLDLQKATTIQSCFSNSAKLIEIEGLVISDSCKVVSAFDNCKSLEKVIMGGTIGQNGFDIHWSTKLTADSLKSIIQTLSTTTTGLTITLPTTAQSNYEAGYGSGSWATLTATRSNWTIAYA